MAEINTEELAISSQTASEKPAKRGLNLVQKASSRPSTEPKPSNAPVSQVKASKSPKVSAKKQYPGPDDPSWDDGDNEFENAMAKMPEEDESPSIIEGIIVEIKDDQVFVDVNDKTEGVVNASEIEGTNFKAGDKIKVAITGRRNGRALLSYQKALRKQKVVDFIESYDESKHEGTVYVRLIGSNRGGFVCVDKDDIEFFLTKSGAFFKDQEKLKARSTEYLPAKIVKIDREKATVIISRKRWQEQNFAKRKQAIDECLADGRILEADILRINEHGMIVLAKTGICDLEGFVHNSEVSYKNTRDANLFYKVGEKVPLKLIRYDDEKGRISFSIKATMQDPWDEMKDVLEVGDILKVTVSSFRNHEQIERSYALVDLGNDFEAILPLHEISWDKNPFNQKSYVKVGDEIDVEVIEINPGQRYIKVSLRNLQERPFVKFAREHKVGDVVEGEISSITDFGAFIRIKECMVDGLLHNNDVSWKQDGTCAKLFKRGDTLTLRINKIDEKAQQISLSLKDLEENPAAAYIKAHKVGELVKGKVRNISPDFGIFVDIAPGVDALLRKEDAKDADSLQVGQELEASIFRMDDRRNTIRLSMKMADFEKEREALKEVNGDEKITLGDALGVALGDALANAK